MRTSSVGNRSILARADSIEIRDRVNDVKGRERWRPLSPAILSAEAELAFGDLKDSNYMLVAGRVAAAWTAQLQGATHVDGTARPQVVLEELNGPFFELLGKFQNMNGSGAVLNTSFNLDFEPIVCTPRDALRTFFSSGLDALAMGPFLVTKHP